MKIPIVTVVVVVVAAVAVVVVAAITKMTLIKAKRVNLKSMSIATTTITIIINQGGMLMNANLITKKLRINENGFLIMTNKQINV